MIVIEWRRFMSNIMEYFELISDKKSEADWKGLLRASRDESICWEDVSTFLGNFPE